MGLLSGVNFMLHAAGWLEGGLVASFEKFVMDADQLGVLHHLARGVDVSETGQAMDESRKRLKLQFVLHKLAEGIAVDDNAQAMDAIREVGPGGHYLGCAHTQANFKEAFWRTGLLDYKPFETWADEGQRDTASLAEAKVARMLEDYQVPAMDPGTAEALAAYVAGKKASMPDAFT